ncbi:hypothetical protein FNV43_RR00491 [Rhamnella rubrinervis]|uniref:Uncharacterized protein n=1 Tax=Rhamnella rubrinervis TaxID=2594499 RepID=A0A8K0HQR1_9ROSA|nr:hypothetical protein FNV43_RR00491 [Rhamnella rubrinervis]
MGMWVNLIFDSRAWLRCGTGEHGAVHVLLHFNILDKDTLSNPRDSVEGCYSKAEYMDDASKGGFTYDGDDFPMPEKGDDGTRLKVGEVAFLIAFFEYGFFLPFLPMYCEILHKWGLAPRNYKNMLLLEKAAKYFSYEILFGEGRDDYRMDEKETQFNEEEWGWLEVDSFEVGHSYFNWHYTFALYVRQNEISPIEVLVVVL